MSPPFDWLPRSVHWLLCLHWCELGVLLFDPVLPHMSKGPNQKNSGSLVRPKQCQCESALSVTSPCCLQEVLELHSWGPHRSIVELCLYVCMWEMLFCCHHEVAVLLIVQQSVAEETPPLSCAPSPLPVPPAVCGHMMYPSPPPPPPLSSRSSSLLDRPLHLLTPLPPPPPDTPPLSLSSSPTSPVGGVPGVRLWRVFGTAPPGAPLPHTLHPVPPRRGESPPFLLLQPLPSAPGNSSSSQSGAGCWLC